MSNKRKDYKLCLSEANVFYRIAKGISDRNLLLQNGESYPFAVNISFSCELYLKYLLHNNSIEYGNNHKLDELFDLLPEHLKKEIDLRFGKVIQKSVREFLKDQGNTFVNWRYAFENNELILDFSGFMKFAGILRSIANHNIETINNRRIQRIKKDK